MQSGNGTGEFGRFLVITYAATYKEVDDQSQYYFSVMHKNLDAQNAMGQP